MDAEILILQICDFLDDGDGFYRLHEPSRCLSRLPGVVVVDCHYYHHLLPGLIDAADVIVLPFVHDWDLFSMIAQRRAAGQVTVFEANDNFYDVQPWSPIAQQWRDRSIQEEYRHFLAFADGVQTSTAELARHWRPLARQVAVFPNQLSEIPPLPPPPDRPLTIGWGGSPSHFADWYEVAPLLQRWLLAHPDVHLAVMTNEFAQPFVQLPAERYHFTPFGSLASYLKFLPSLDIGLAPLLPTGYNRGRSDVKFLEYAAHGAAGIYADLEPYRDSVQPGETGLMYRTGPELLQCLDRLASDKKQRLRIRDQAHAHVARERRVMDHIGARLDFYRDLFRAPPRGGQIGDMVLAVAVRDGRYLQLRPGELEKSLLAALNQKPPEAIQALARLVQQQPRYEPALFNLGRLLNDVRDYRQAQIYLEQARAAKPHSARILCELARVRFLQGDVAGSRRMLEDVLEANPYYYPGWQYLLRLLGLHLAPEGPQWTDRARQLFPTSYALALLGTGTYPPDQRVAYLHRLLDGSAPSFKLEELPEAADAFGQGLMSLNRALLLHPDGCVLLRRACEVFPQSARLANLAGAVLHQVGEEAESQEQFVRALGLQRAAALYQSEFPRADGSIFYWQFAEHILKWRGENP
jgi:tetratricopeptide (TPR) repeat protein